MIAWIESQRTGMIALLVFGFSWILAGVILLAFAGLSRRRIAADLKASTPVMLTPLSVVISLLIVFLAARVWTNLDGANNQVTQEAGALYQVIMLADAMPADSRAMLRASVETYLHFVETEDWPAMALGQANSQRPPPGLAEAVQATLSFNPSTPGQVIAQQRLANALEQALEARRRRIQLSRAVILPIQWEVIILLDLLILAMIAMVHIDRRVTAAVNLFVFSTAVASCLVLLMVHDRPFTAGGFTLEPAMLREISVGN
jgi:Protein of unknown function (DUF4239)